MESTTLTNHENGNDANHLLAAANEMMQSLEDILEKVHFSKKQEYNSSFNVNDLRPRAEKAIAEYKEQESILKAYPLIHSND